MRHVRLLVGSDAEQLFVLGWRAGSPFAVIVGSTWREAERRILWRTRWSIVIRPCPWTGIEQRAI
jgi:hypothetical protein